jgi:glucose/arabinose dehydrogenase
MLALGLLVACTTPPPAPEPTTGVLEITVANLPAGVPAAIRVTGPGGYLRDLSGSQALTDLVPGIYTVSAASVASGGLTYLPSAGLQNVVVAAGAIKRVSLSYTGVQFGLGLEVTENIPGAVFLTAAPGDRARQFIVEREGRIRVRENGMLLATPFLDINERVLAQGEGGLLSMAFHPDYASNGYFFLYYTDKLHRATVERWRVSADPNRAAPGSDLAILRIQKINVTHNGGLVSFGPDGYLYLAVGDDGGTGDPFRNAQNLDRLLGKVLRLDVSNASAAEPYTIPPSNPFAGQAGRRGEIWAYGLRNPWRYSFDADLLYLGDVGQGEREEVSVSSLNHGGLNFGWPIMEGTTCYDRPSCDRTGLTLPVLDYDHGNGCSITGGYVYRGNAIPELAGHYLYSDFCSGFLRSFVFTGMAVTAQADWLIADPGNIQSFGRDADGELYMIASSGSIYRIVRTSAPPGQAPERKAWPAGLFKR